MHKQDRYAASRVVPVPDESQDWTLLSGETKNGRTILEFERKLTTCDDKDMDITVRMYIHACCYLFTKHIAQAV